ncbi:uncharacterized protein LOC134693220 isoform X2 [Mytilus trossulus]|uniref:uncharacterized protein LOC134693220 isoform X2 n=1 Tax=Mytilus trossulus TaxID=6551 RepID=UPI003007577E
MVTTLPDRKSKGMECIHCTDFVVDTSSIPSKVKQYLDGIHTYRTPKCENAHTVEVDKGVTMKTCKSVHGNSSGEVSKCGRLVTTVKVTIRRGEIVVPVTFHIRGCFNVEQSLNRGCYPEKSILNQQREGVLFLLKRFINRNGLSSYRVGELNGVLCVNGANNTDPWRSWRRNAAMGHTNNWMTFFVCAMVSLFFIYKI